MDIKTIGGEFALIDRLHGIVATQQVNVIKGIGDDAAVLRVAPEPAPYLLVTTDILVDGRHFRRNWATAEQIGIKAAECNISDIAAMGGRPQWMFTSIVLPADTQVDWIEALYRGIRQSCNTRGIALLGGDTTQGELFSITITLLGSVSQDHLCLRSHAQADDYIMVTGTLGASAAALMVLETGSKPSQYLLEKHLTPRSRMDIVDCIAPVANAMIDISDGLAAEIHHICQQSHVGAQIQASMIPIHPDVKNIAANHKIPPLELALGGGEDFELLFTISAENKALLDKCDIGYYNIGRITKHKDQILLITPEGVQKPLVGGYNHFR